MYWRDVILSHAVHALNGNSHFKLAIPSLVAKLNAKATKD